MPAQNVDLTSEDLKGTIHNISKVTFFMKNGLTMTIETPIEFFDFGLLWNDKKKKVLNIMTSDSSWAMIKKKEVMAFEIKELSPFDEI